MQIRRFTPAGVSEFENRLILIKAGSTADITALVFSDIYTEIIGDVDAPELPQQARREDAGIYLNYVLRDIDTGDVQIDSDVGLWSWLAAKFFDVLSPLNAENKRSVREIARYVLDPTDYTKYYRHFLNGPYRIAKTHRENIGNARVVLATPLNAPGEAVEQIASRQEFISNSALLSLATHLYVDTQTQELKKGSGGSGAGSPRRFGKVLAQLDRTWDTESMTTEALLSLLPQEFDRFR